ncbi:zinc finger, CCHC-type containing protein [Tanacetum coccineum]
MEALRVFGCKAYAKVTKPHLKKLDDRSRELVYLGTEPGSKAYRVLDPVTKEIVVSRDVKFKEDEGWDWKAQVDQGSQIKMIQVKEMMQDNDLKNLKSKDKGSKSRSQSMDEQSHYKQDKTITRQSINVKRHIFNVIGDTEKFEERDLNIGGDC